MTQKSAYFTYEKSYGIINLRKEIKALKSPEKANKIHYFQNGDYYEQEHIYNGKTFKG